MWSYSCMAHNVVFISLYINTTLKDYIYDIYIIYIHTYYVYTQLTHSVYKHYMHIVYTNQFIPFLANKHVYKILYKGQ